MSTIQQSPLPILVETALADAQFKVVQGIWHGDILFPSERWGTVTEHQFDRNHPYLQASDEARELCVALGRFCREFNLDPSESPLVKNLHFKSLFEKEFELGRVVISTELTPVVLHDAVEKRNILHWEGWIITAGELDFSTDAYGLDEYIRPLIAKHESGEPEIKLWMAGQSKDRAREAYRQITGSEFTGEDGLGPDPRHMCEPYLNDDEIWDFVVPDSEDIDGEALIDLMVLNAKQEIEHMCEDALQRIACDMPL
jgi:hypothetical protein